LRRKRVRVRGKKLALIIATKYYRSLYEIIYTSFKVYADQGEKTRKSQGNPEAGFDKIVDWPDDSGLT
jgi:hypothetical protein